MRVDQKGCTHRASDRCTHSFQASGVTHDYLTANRLRPRRSIIGRASAIPAFTPTPAHPSGRVKGAWKRANGRNDHPANSLTAPGPRVARRPTGIAECPRHHASRMQCRPMQISTWTGVRRQASATSSINHVVRQVWGVLRGPFALPVKKGMFMSSHKSRRCGGVARLGRARPSAPCTTPERDRVKRPIILNDANPARPKCNTLSHLRTIGQANPSWPPRATSLEPPTSTSSAAGAERLAFSTKAPPRRRRAKDRVSHPLPAAIPFRQDRSVMCAGAWRRWRR